MIVRDLSAGALARTLSGSGLRLRTGPVVTSIRTRLRTVIDGIRLHYAEHPIEPDTGFADFHVRVAPGGGIRRFWRRQVFFLFEDASSFNPLPIEHAFPMLEWGLNWCVSAHCHSYLVVHAAVLERGGRALLMPAPPGSGKSTLCAALALSGWRLLSDELALIEMDTLAILPLPRPVSLKNASIDLIRMFSPDALIGPPVPDTTKGTVAHMRPPPQSVHDAQRPAMPAWVVFPRYVAGSAASFEPVGKARAFMQLADNAFNYDVHGRAGFATLARLVDACACTQFTYARLDEAVPLFEMLATRE